MISTHLKNITRISSNWKPPPSLKPPSHLVIAKHLQTHTTKKPPHPPMNLRALKTSIEPISVLWQNRKPPLMTCTSYFSCKELQAKYCEVQNLGESAPRNSGEILGWMNVLMDVEILKVAKLMGNSGKRWSIFLQKKDSRDGYWFSWRIYSTKKDV